MLDKLMDILICIALILAIIALVFATIGIANMVITEIILKA